MATIFDRLGSAARALFQRRVDFSHRDPSIGPDRASLFDSVYQILNVPYVSDDDFAAGKDAGFYDSILRDPQVANCWSIRRNVLTGLEWEVVATNEKDKKLAAEVNNVIDTIRHKNKLLRFTEDAVLKGCSHIEVHWDTINGYWVPVDFDWTEKEDFYWKPNVGWHYTGPNGIYGVPGLRMVGRKREDEETQAEDHQELGYEAASKEGLNPSPIAFGKFFVPVFDQSIDHPFGRGLGQSIYWPVTFKWDGLKNWAKAQELYSNPWKVIKGDTELQRSAMEGIIEDIKNSPNIFLPPGVDVDFKMPTGINQGQEAWAKFHDDAIAKVLLGATLTTDTAGGASSAGGGAYALGAVHESIMQQKQDSDILFAAESLTYGSRYMPGLLEAIVRANWPDRNIGSIEIRLKRPAQFDRAQYIQELMQVGSKIKLDEEDIRDRLDYKPHEPGKTVFGEEAPEGGGGGGDMFGGMFGRDKDKKENRVDFELSIESAPPKIYDALEAKKEKLFADALGGVPNIVEWWEKINESEGNKIEELMRLADTIGPLLGIADVMAREEVSKAVREDVKRADFAAKPLEEFEPISQDAVDWWQEKGLVGGDIDLQEHYWQQGYTAANDFANAVDNVIEKRIARGVERGVDRDKMVTEMLKEPKIPDEQISSRLENIVRTNMARVRGGVSIEASEESPFIAGWVYHTAGDNRVRDSHIVLDELAVEKGDDSRNLRTRLRDPNGYQCRCYWQAIPNVSWPDTIKRLNAKGKGLVLYEKLPEQIVDAARPPDWQGAQA